MAEMMDHPSYDPHGDPIPDRDGHVPRLEGQDLLSAPLGQDLVIRHVDDQSARFLRFAASTGLVPGCTLRILARDEAADTVTVDLAGGERLEMGHRAASKILAASS
jgi:DtxR family Mn-dependent transcriptional regulator